ncbi:hypothetical+protein [Methylocapsa aurea]
MVHCEQYDALALCSRGTDTEIERLHPQQRACGEIEWATRFLGGEAQRFRLPHLLVERAEIDDRRLDLEPGGDHLGRGAVAKDEGGAEHVVPPDDLIDGEGEGQRVEIADDAQCGGYVVGGVPGLELIEKPQSLLREGERQRRGARGSVHFKRRIFNIMRENRDDRCFMNCECLPYLRCDGSFRSGTLQVSIDE